MLKHVAKIFKKYIKKTERKRNEQNQTITHTFSKIEKWKKNDALFKTGCIYKFKHVYVNYIYIQKEYFLSMDKKKLKI